MALLTVDGGAWRSIARRPVRSALRTLSDVPGHKVADPTTTEAKLKLRDVSDDATQLIPRQVMSTRLIGAPEWIASRATEGIAQFTVDVSAVKTRPPSWAGLSGWRLGRVILVRTAATRRLRILRHPPGQVAASAAPGPCPNPSATSSVRAFPVLETLQASPQTSSPALAMEIPPHVGKDGSLLELGFPGASRARTAVPNPGQDPISNK